MDGEKIEKIVEDEYTGTRIDKYLAVTHADSEQSVSRSYIQKLISEGHVIVNEKPVKSNYKVCAGDELEYFIPAPVDLEIVPEDIPLDILYEDSDVILVNKPKNMVVHPAAGHYTGTLVNALMYHCKDSLSGINGIMRPGIVHRIDMNTTGVIVICKNDAAHRFIADQLKVHSITRKYDALVYGAFDEDTGRIEGSIGRHPAERKKMAINVKNGKPAVTNYSVLERFGNKYAHVECRLETGRTHQIRVHMSSINHPLLGDDVYGHRNNEFKLTGQALHARVLGFIHPSTHKYVEFEAPIPDYFTGLEEKLRNKSN